MTFYLIATPLLWSDGHRPTSIRFCPTTISLPPYYSSESLSAYLTCLWYIPPVCIFSHYYVILYYVSMLNWAILVLFGKLHHNLYYIISPWHHICQTPLHCLYSLHQHRGQTIIFFVYPLHQFILLTSEISFPHYLTTHLWGICINDIHDHSIKF